MPPRGMPGKGSASASTAASAPPPNYALPAAEGVPISDDWSRVHDRKEKKRMQNRVAQRTFRNDTPMNATWNHLVTDLLTVRKDIAPGHASKSCKQGCAITS